MPLWLQIVLFLFLSGWFAYASLWAMAWLVILTHVVWFLVAHRGQYSLLSPRDRHTISWELGVVLEKDPTLRELMALRMFPGRACRWVWRALHACYDRCTRRKR